ncbi:MAG: hypothetical protein J3K34DRAFT_526897 [Monoraphidium minutum]|nr:MAG: hypothetical protein J3K34DRAFT_526897 [Monoraphidium minutum]
MQVRRAAAPAPLCAKKKGFSNEAQAAGLKVNSRGKISSRPGPAPRKQQAQQPAPQPDEPMQPQQQQAAAASPPAPAAAPAASSSAAAPPQQRPPPPTQQQQQQQQPVAAVADSGTPQPVIDRMAKRVAAFAIVPVAGGVAALGAFWYLKVVAKVEYPLWVAYLGSTLMFGGGLAGITYGILSTSWDPRRDGTFWGWTEVQANIAVLMDKNKQGR